MKLPTIRNYSPKDNNRDNTLQVELGSLTVYFSYTTPIAYEHNGTRVVRVNDWSKTTGKHLTYIDGGGKEAKAKRISGAEFEAKLNSLLEKFKLIEGD